MKIESVNKDSLISSLAKAEKEQLAPAGYLQIKLSTKGKIAAPSSFHIRNFKTSDVLALSLTETRDLPARIIELLNSMIYEEDVDVAKFHEKEVIETMVKLYATYYGTTFKDVIFPYNEEDLQYIRDKYSKKEADDLINDLATGKWIPTTDIDIINGVHTYPVSDNWKPTATITNKSTGFTLAFRMPLYGDVVTVRKYLASTFEEEEKALAPIRQKLEIRERILDSYREGNAIDFSKIPYISDEEEQAYNTFTIKQASTSVELIRALHLSHFDGEDVTGKSIAERMQLVMDPRVDARIAKKLDEHFEAMEFGIKELVTMQNPITGQSCERRFLFRPAFILQATRLSDTDEYEFVFN